MPWTIDTKTKEIAEGDNGRKMVTFDVKWDGKPLKDSKAVTFKLKINDGTATDDGVFFPEDGKAKHVTFNFDPKKADGNTKFEKTASVTVEFNSDTRDESDESFSVEIEEAHWVLSVDGVDTPGPVQKKIGKSQAVTIKDDDEPFDPGASKIYVIDQDPEIIKLDDEETDVFDFFVGYGHDRPAGSLGGREIGEIEAPGQPSDDGGNEAGLDPGLLPLVPFETVTDAVGSFFDWV